MTEYSKERSLQVEWLAAAVFTEGQKQVSQIEQLFR